MIPVRSHGSIQHDYITRNKMKEQLIFTQIGRSQVIALYKIALHKNEFPHRIVSR